MSQPRLPHKEAPGDLTAVRLNTGNTSRRSSLIWLLDRASFVKKALRLKPWLCQAQS
jgi:hypothetical protein